MDRNYFSGGSPYHDDHITIITWEMDTVGWDRTHNDGYVSFVFFNNYNECFDHLHRYNVSFAPALALSNILTEFPPGTTQLQVTMW